MDQNFNEIDINTLREFIDGDVHDVYLFVKKCYYRDMYMTIYKYGFKRIINEDSKEQLIDKVLFIYKLQNNLNASLKVTDGKYFDDYLMRRVIDEVFRKFEDHPALRDETHSSFMQKVVDIRRKSISTDLTNKQDMMVLTNLLKDKFVSSDLVGIDEVLKYIDELIPSDTKIELEEDHTNFTNYLNHLIDIKNITLNQLGNESLIKKGVYDISLGKIPTKNQLIAISIALKLDIESSKKLFSLAYENVKNTAESNMYTFDKENNRDIIILHWINNIEALEHLANKKNKNMVSTLNGILRDSKFEEIN